LTNVPYADPVYLNIPGNTLGDIQTNAEYVSYAVNYISGISSNKNVSLVTWSQGSLISRWAEKYWPSINKRLSVTVHISPDFHGTVLAYLLCPGFPQTPCPPAIRQQEYNSTFIATLRNNGGESPYAPLTSVYSLFDEIVQPQISGPGASGFSPDKRDVGATNVFLQDICGSLLPGGASYNTHEGVLYNALGFALAKDSLTNGRSADLTKLDTAKECQKLVADGLVLGDVLATESRHFFLRPYKMLLTKFRYYSYCRPEYTGLSKYGVEGTSH
jgi:hypothetical protein